MATEETNTHTADEPRMVREKATITAMVLIYCRSHHASDGQLCAECYCGRVWGEFHCRLDGQPFQGAILRFSSDFVTFPLGDRACGAARGRENLGKRAVFTP